MFSVLTYIILLFTYTFSQMQTNALFTQSDILSHRRIKSLPKYLKIGYASWNQCDDKVFTAVQQGLNVIIWFSIDLSTDPHTHTPSITRGPNYEEVAAMIHKLNEAKYSDVIHLISIGGWNSPHVSTNHTASEFLECWLNFNRNISNPALGFYGFDGFDWDIEGNDDMSSPYNAFTLSELDLMGELSKLAKEKGYIVSMAPSESYLDYTTSEFSLSLLHVHEEWKQEVGMFYHGRNVYAYLVKKYGDVFDFISVQLYEGYTHTLYRYRNGEKFGKILEEMITNLNKGYIVEFNEGKEMVRVAKEKLVIGVANAWAEGRFLYVNKADMKEAFHYLKEKNIECRGIMFWNLKDEGMVHVDDKTKTPLYMSEVINSIFSDI